MKAKYFKLKPYKNLKNQKERGNIMLEKEVKRKIMQIILITVVGVILILLIPVLFSYYLS